MPRNEARRAAAVALLAALARGAAPARVRERAESGCLANTKPSLALSV